MRIWDFFPIYLGSLGSSHFDFSYGENNVNLKWVLRITSSALYTTTSSSTLQIIHCYKLAGFDKICLIKCFWSSWTVEILVIGLEYSLKPLSRYCCCKTMMDSWNVDRVFSIFCSPIIESPQCFKYDMLNYNCRIILRSWNFRFPCIPISAKQYLFLEIITIFETFSKFTWIFYYEVLFFKALINMSSRILKMMHFHFLMSYSFYLMFQWGFLILNRFCY